ncbi:putative ATP-dependent endonuclease of OLD family [Aminobacter aminovorans]|nr:putative ATP-dependent endonuclease of OLD family [Aminobacter aminovorans]
MSLHLTSPFSLGRNNSGKTSATQAMQMFLSGGKDAFSLYDFSTHVWPLLDEIGEREDEIAEFEFPTVSLDLWFEVRSGRPLSRYLYPAFDRLGRNARRRPCRTRAEENRRIDRALPRCS